MQDTRKSRSDPVGGNETSVPSSSQNEEQLKQQLEQLKLHNNALRRKLFESQKIGPTSTGIILLSIGAVALMFAFLSSMSILVFIGLGITLWGLLLIYISPTRHIRAEILNSFSASMQRSIDSLLKFMGYTGEVIFFHPKSLTGLGQGFIYIPHYVAKSEEPKGSKLDVLNLLPYNNQTDVPSPYLEPRGIFLAAPSQSIVDLFEKELEVNLATVDLTFVQESLPRLFVEELKIADDTSIEANKDGTFTIKVTGGPCISMCKFVSKETHLGDRLGCPLCSAVALVMSKVTGKPVTIKETRVIDDSISTTYTELNA